MHVDTGRLEVVTLETSSDKPRIVVIASYTRSLDTFRLDLLRRFVDAGYIVHAFAPDEDAETIGILSGAGVQFDLIPMARASLTPMGDLVTLMVIWRKLRRLKPDLLLAYTMKPIIYGLIAGRLAGTPRRFAMVTGLGWAFGEHDVSWRRKLVRAISLRLYRQAFVGAKKIFVYNDADARDILAPGLVRDPARVLTVPGSGVNLEGFPDSPPRVSPPMFLMIARLLREKGVLDFVEAARRLRREHPSARFILVGPLDPNPTGFTQAQVDDWEREGAVEYLGETRDVRPFLAECGVFVLPTYYREGVPRTLLEALATGRAVVTTDLPGCRDAVVDGINGFLVPPRDPVTLARVLARFTEDPDLIRRMGVASRRLAEDRFDVHSVNTIIVDAMALRRVDGLNAASDGTRLSA